ncbi:hypothetical protein ANN_26709 [Periplaneta americana]|uniref:CRAL-TRIO domain-containing protein n=1 Tax=Periplaneta americana TaxID=6978 RepID=A0ABQ8RZ00_PERAM|nr:hypothetical protein ANN_26709 [Periplaneta americana]
MAREFRSPNKDVVQKIWKEFGLNEQRVKESVEALKKWLAMEPHLPEESGSLHEVRLERWLIRCKNSMERTKQSIDLYYTLKSLSPEMMSDWNTQSKWFKTISKLAYYKAMPQLTSEYDRVVCFGILSKDPTDLVIEDWYRMALMTIEVRMCEDYTTRDIFIFDLANLTQAHVDKFSFPSMKKVEVCTMVILYFNLLFIAMPVILIQGHFPTIDDMYRKHSVHVHGTDLTELHKQVPKESLPTEMGGCGGSIIDNWNPWLKKLETYQDWFLQHENVKSDEKKRLGGKAISRDLFGFEDSFREPDVD